MLIVLQIIGALLILAPFTAQQFGKLGPEAPAYLWPNLIGSGRSPLSRSSTTSGAS